MEIQLSVPEVLDRARSRKGLSKAGLARAAKISPTTLDKIYEVGSEVKTEKVTAVELVLGITIGTIAALTEGKPLGDISKIETEVTEFAQLKTGERLFEQESESGIKYRLEIEGEYGASYTWEHPTPYPEVVKRLRTLCKIIATAGDLIDP